MSNHLLKMLKNDPLSLRTFLMNITERDLYKKYFLNNSLIHLIAIYYPIYLSDIIYLPVIDNPQKYNSLFKSKNFFGYTWLHIICQYHMHFYNYLKVFIDDELIVMQDKVGNTCLHLVARFNPDYLKLVVTDPIVKDYLLFKQLNNKKLRQS